MFLTHQKRDTTILVHTWNSERSVKRNALVQQWIRYIAYFPRDLLYSFIAVTKEQQIKAIMICPGRKGQRVTLSDRLKEADSYPIVSNNRIQQEHIFKSGIIKVYEPQWRFFVLIDRNNSSCINIGRRDNRIHSLLDGANLENCCQVWDMDR